MKNYKQHIGKLFCSANQLQGIVCWRKGSETIPWKYKDWFYRAKPHRPSDGPIVCIGQEYGTKIIDGYFFKKQKYIKNKNRLFLKFLCSNKKIIYIEAFTFELLIFYNDIILLWNKEHSNS